VTVVAASGSGGNVSEKMADDRSHRYFLRSRHGPETAAAAAEAVEAAAARRREQQQPQQQQQQQKRRQQQPQQPQFGPVDAFDFHYYNPHSPGSFSGVDALARQLKGIKSRREVEEWLQTQPTYTLHKPVRKRFRRNVILVHGVDEQFQADLADVSMLARWNNGTKFLLTCIDVFSKRAWAVPMRDKTAESTRAAFAEIFSERKPKQLLTDSGREFDNHIIRNYMKEQGVQHIFAWNPDIKASVVERFNRTVKGRIYRVLTYKGSERYIDDLKDIEHAYNNNYHRSIKMTPMEASRPENTKRVWQNLYGKRVRYIPPSRIKFKYKLGDYVRISEERGAFRKGYKQGWSHEVYRVVKCSPRDPVVYKLEDLAGDPLIGSFYEPELQKVSPPPPEEVAAALRNRRNNARDLQYFVKYKGYPDYQQPRQQQQPAWVQ
jgi:Integrase core domain